MFYAWNEINILQLDRAMYAYRALVGMDLSFELYGHLLRKDGTVIGLVSEAGKRKAYKSVGSHPDIWHYREPSNSRLPL